MRRKKLLIIVVLIIAIPSIMFILDDYFRSEFENPIRVGKAFSYSYMTKNSKSMKSWTDKKTYNKIDELKYLTPVEDFGIIGTSVWEDFKLVCFRRLGHTIVSTYAYDRFEEPPFLYSAVLKPVGPLSLWERCREFIYFRVPLGNRFVGWPHTKQRWLVADFFTGDMDAYEKDITAFFNKTPDVLISELRIDTEEMLEEIDQRLSYEDKWGKTEKIRQNEEMKVMYRNYKVLHDKNSEENLLEENNTIPSGEN